MLQGRDGVGGCPCVGTGVVFRRDILMSMGGQAYGSITEDYNSAMQLMGDGFSTMFLNERLVFGLAPTNLEDALVQRLRWSMGSLQIFFRTNPFTFDGLTIPQTLLFGSSVLQYWMCFPVVILVLFCPWFMITRIPPFAAPLSAFILFFYTPTFLNRAMLFLLNTARNELDLQAGSDMFIYMIPTYFEAIWKVVTVETALGRWFRKLVTCGGVSGAIGFAVTAKGQAEVDHWKGFSYTYPFIAYYLLVAYGFTWSLTDVVFKFTHRFWSNASLQDEYDVTTTVYETLVAWVWAAMAARSMWPIFVTFIWDQDEGTLEWDEPLAREASRYSAAAFSRREASRYMSKRQSSRHPRYSNSAEGSSKFTLGEGSTTGRVSTRGRREILQEQLVSDAHVPLTEDPNVRQSELEAAVDEEIHKIQEQAGRLHVNLGTKDELRSFFQRGVSTRTVELDLGLVEQANSALKAHTSRKGMEMARHLSRRGSVKRAPTAKKEELQSTITGTLGKQQSFKAITRATSMSFTFVNLFMFILFVGVGVYIYARFGGGRTLASWFTAPQGSMLFAGVDANVQGAPTGPQ